MNGLLKKGIILHHIDQDIKIIELLGSGGQGEVYKVEYNNKHYALKWYFPDTATPEQKKILEDLILKKQPNENFLWPILLVESEEFNSFGYLMELRTKEYKGIVDLMKNKCSPSFYNLATVGFHTSNSFLQLHSRGLCYKDISFGNLFFNPNNGDVKICDNDNVTPDAQDFSGVLGTPKFMAPEIVRGDRKPSTQTDLYSLAILLFYVFFVHHPLDGSLEMKIKCMDAPAMKKLYGDDPIFIFDPNNSSNRPVKGEQDNALIYWSIYPQFFKDLFIKSFTDGIHDPLNGRVRESEWRNIFIKLRDSIFYCECGAENFYDLDSIKANQGTANACWSCNKIPTLPYRMKINNSILMINYNTKFYPHHIDPQRKYELIDPIAEVSTHPQDPTIWGIKNLSKEKWVMTDKAGNLNEVVPGKNCKIENGIKINFGSSEGEIKY
ncbi:MAG: protein kinase [Leptospiraceae bacterium]|nr:protein kinase [Leptospiraceae bacterium]MCP5513374.1 protein kinase [Leptospiraceae bacterium]